MNLLKKVVEIGFSSRASRHYILLLFEHIGINLLLELLSELLSFLLLNSFRSLLILNLLGKVRVDLGAQSIFPQVIPISDCVVHELVSKRLL